MLTPLLAKTRLKKSESISIATKNYDKQAGSADGVGFFLAVPIKAASLKDMVILMVTFFDTLS